MIIKGAEPFFLMGGEAGVLLIHGFSGIPAEMYLLGKSLQDAGFTVLAPRLTGHGGNAKMLEGTTAENWMDAVRDGYAILKGAVKRIYVAGHSMGGVLSLILASEEDVAGVITIAAPITIAKERGISLLPPREISRGMYIPKAQRKNLEGPKIINRRQEMPLLSVHEMLDVIEEAKNRMKKITAPTFVIHSKNDHTADPESAGYIIDHIKSQKKRLKLLTEFGHLIPMQEGKEEVFKDIVEFIKKEEAEW